MGENGEIELNEYGLKVFIADNIKKGERITNEELLRRINRKLKKKNLQQ